MRGLDISFPDESHVKQVLIGTRELAQAGFIVLQAKGGKDGRNMYLLPIFWAGKVLTKQGGQ